MFAKGKINNLSIRTRILGIFLIIITLSVFIVAATTYYIGEKSLEKTITAQLNGSVRSVIDQISLLTGAYNSRQFSSELNHVLISEKVGFNQADLSAKIYLINSSGNEINTSNVQEDTGKKTDLPDTLIKKAFNAKNGCLDIRVNGEERLIAFGYIIEKDWIYMVSVPKSSFLRTIYLQLLITVISGIIAIGLAFLFSYIGTRGIISAIKDLNKALSQAGRGNLKIRAAANHGGPELRSLANNLNTMLSNFEKLIMELSTSIEELTAESKELANIANISSGSTGQVYELTKKMAEGTVKQEEILKSTSDSTVRIIRRTQEVIQHMDATGKESNIMLDTVRLGLESINELNMKIANIEEVSNYTLEHIKVVEAHSNEISKILNTLNSISVQTKLLSLNASIEAARAGEFGMGFSVVAQEIQKLAQSSAQSAYDAGKIIREIQSSMNEVIEIANLSKAVSYEGRIIAGNTNKAFDLISNKVTQTHESIKKVSGNASEISEDIGIFSENIETITGIINEVSAASCEVASSVESHFTLSNGIFSSAHDLQSIANKLNELKDEFKGRIERNG